MKKVLVFILVILTLFTLPVSCTASSAAGDIQEKGIIVIRAIRWVGYAVSLGMVVYIGIKYMLGAADAKANMKTAITSWLIGALIVFMATTIISWVLTGIGTSSNASASGEARNIIDKAKQAINGGE